MAEYSFQEVMHQFDRMCKANPGCFNCPLHHSNYYSDDESHIVVFVRYPEKIEQTVMSWAADHPEPVYPTWGEWLMEQMVIAERMRPKYDYTNGERTYELERTGEYIAIDSEMKKQIPADIAEKLGIEPKEG